MSSDKITINHIATFLGVSEDFILETKKDTFSIEFQLISILQNQSPLFFANLDRSLNYNIEIRINSYNYTKNEFLTKLSFDLKNHVDLIKKITGHNPDLYIKHPHNEKEKTKITIY